MTVKERYKGVVEWFEQEMPEPQTELDYRSTYELLVAVILSAQCTDKRINMVTPDLFKAYPTVSALAKAEAEDIYPFIKSVTFPNNKSKALVRMAKKVVQDYNGEIPRHYEDLISLPGVGRKTAHVLLSVIYGDNVLAVDTHVFRVSERLGLTTNSKNPLQTEKALVKHLPAGILAKSHHWLILHGRYTCQARKPQCEECGLKQLCRQYQREQKKLAKKAQSQSETKPDTEK